MWNHEAGPYPETELSWNAGILSMAQRDYVKARSMLVAYLNEYQKVLATSSFQLIDSKISADKLEHMAQNARDRLMALGITMPDLQPKTVQEWGESLVDRITKASPEEREEMRRYLLEWARGVLSPQGNPQQGTQSTAPQSRPDVEAGIPPKTGKE